ncbi:armadillo-type protein [Suillus discolor]|uniref:Armadillo-type protein n=1 Tax=Suillus discolor TaxID=1912936 RepID=A0A9P7EWK3_9AGAM|nr:armadillo-type protein [Suillus discolor]KAG2092282.1 armadillo-type protein [Suillus discolor]
MSEWKEWPDKIRGKSHHQVTVYCLVMKGTIDVWHLATHYLHYSISIEHRSFGNPSQLPSPMQKEYGVFAQNFATAFAPKIFKVYLHQVELYVSGQAWLGKKCQYQIFQFFTEWITLTFDPSDYADVFIHSIKLKLTWIFLKPHVDNLVANFAFPQLTFNVSKQAMWEADPIEYVHASVVLGPFIVRHPNVKGSIEQFMACEVLGVVTKAGITWATEENLNNHSCAVALALDDQELPVRVQAALAITELVVIYDSVRDAISPQVGKVVQDLLKLSDETDLDILNHSMEAMVDWFQNELMPVASQLMARLASALSSSHYYNTLTAYGNDDKVYGAMGVAKTIGTVQEVIIPIIRFTLENKLIDLFDNMYDLVDALTFHLHAISPNMWPVFELTYDLFKSDAVDFLDEMLPSLDNFMSYGTDVLKAHPDYRSKLGDNDKINGCKLAESMLLNLHGHVDHQLQYIITIAAEHIDEGETASFHLANLEILVNTILYNASATLHFMEAYKPGFSCTFFERWFAAINSNNKLPRVHDKKLSILALCKLLEMEAGVIPEGLRDGWPGIVGGALNIFKGLPQAVAKCKVLEDQLVKGDNDEDEDETKYLNLEGDKDEDVWDEDSAYLEILAKEGACLREKSEKAETGGDDESDISEESEIEEELGFFSPLDNINTYVTFKEALQTFQNQNSALYQAAMTMLTVEWQIVLMEVVMVANQGDHS